MNEYKPFIYPTKTLLSRLTIHLKPSINECMVNI
jgi:hypothetical protein